MKLETMAFGLCNGKYANLAELARAIGIALSQIYRVRQGRRPTNHEFIIVAVRTFPEYKPDDPFCVVQALTERVVGIEALLRRSQRVVS